MIQPLEFTVISQAGGRPGLSQPAVGVSLSYCLLLCFIVFVSVRLVTRGDVVG